MHTFNGASRRLLCATVVLMTLTIESGAQSRDRAQIPEKFKWNLADIYPTEAAWRAAKDKLAADLNTLGQYRGKVASSAGTLADALERQTVFAKELSRLYTYAQALADQDTRDSTHEGMRQEMIQIASAFSAQSAFIE